MLGCAFPCTAPVVPVCVGCKLGLAFILISEDKPLTVSNNDDLALLIPCANSSTKSPPYSSASDRGPLSGTENPRKSLTLLATFLTVSTTA